MITQVIQKACNSLATRQHYGRDVLRGFQNWSGSDLKGKAKLYSRGYAQQRSTARAALLKAGGEIVQSRRDGRLITAVYIGMDDFGDALYETLDGVLRRRNIR